jgi:hypothetical protein
VVRPPFGQPGRELGPGQGVVSEQGGGGGAEFGQVEAGQVPAEAGGQFALEPR